MIKNKESDYKNIIFDLVGVLFKLDYMKLFTRVGIIPITAYMIRHRKNPITTLLSMLNTISQSEIPSNFPLKYKNYSLPKSMSDWHLGQKTSNEILDEIFKHIEDLDKKHYFASKLEKKTMQNIIKVFYDSKSITATTKLNEKVVDLIKTLKHHNSNKVYLLSNIDKESYSIIQKNHKEVFNLFDGKVLSCNVNLLKPSPLIFEHIINTYHLTPNQSIFIDDQKENIIAAKDIGITGLLYKNSQKTYQELEELGVL